MKYLLALTALSLASPVPAQEAEEPVTPSSVVVGATAEEWTAIAPEDLLVMELAPDARGNDRTVVIQLMPPPYSRPWVANIRTLAGTHWWDGTSVYRVQDNYMTQWGDATEEKTLPPGMINTDSSDYVARFQTPFETLPQPCESDQFSAGAFCDIHADMAVFRSGWPIGMSRDGQWPIHCYGTIGVARDYAPSTGTGSELYTIIGQPQRHMDRNMAVVGRAIEGIEHLSSLPRGSGELGFYTDEEANLHTPILSVRLGSELPDPPTFEYLNTRNESFARYVAVRANRDDPFYTVPAGGVDVCSVQVPVRRAE